MPHFNVMRSFLALLVVVVVPAFAQAPNDSAPRDPRLDLLRGIELTPLQKAQVDSVDEEFRHGADRIERNANSAAETVLSLPQLVARRDSAIRRILTPAQAAIYQRNIDSLRAWARRERHPDR